MNFTSVRAAQMLSTCTAAFSVRAASPVRGQATKSSFHPTRQIRLPSDQLHLIACTAVAIVGQASCGLAKRYLRIGGSSPSSGQSIVIYCLPSVRRASYSQRRVCRVWPRASGAGVVEINPVETELSNDVDLTWRAPAAQALSELHSLLDG